MSDLHYLHVLSMAAFAVVALAVNRRLFHTAVSPLGVWTVTWLVPVGLAVVPLFDYMPPLKPATLGFLWLASLGFFAGAVVCGLVSSQFAPVRERTPPSTELLLRLRRSARIALVVSVVAYLVLVYSLGTVPILSPEAANARVEFRIPYVFSAFNLGKVGFFLYSVIALLPKRSGLGLTNLDWALLVLYGVMTVTTGWRSEMLILLLFWGLPVLLLRPGLISVSWRRVVAAVAVIPLFLAYFYAWDLIRLGTVTATLTEGRIVAVETSVREAVAENVGTLTFWGRPLLYVQPNFVNLQTAMELFVGSTLGTATFGFVLKFLLIEQEVTDWIIRAGYANDLDVYGADQYVGAYNAVTYLPILYYDFGAGGAIVASALFGFVASYFFAKFQCARMIGPTQIFWLVELLAAVVLMHNGWILKSPAMYYWLALVAATEYGPALLRPRRTRSLAARTM